MESERGRNSDRDAGKFREGLGRRMSGLDDEGLLQYYVSIGNCLTYYYVKN